MIPSAQNMGPLTALVVAVADNGVIGAEGGLPWRQSADLKWFKRVTYGKPIVMGRVTFESVGEPLPGRDNIVVSTAMALRKGLTVAGSVADGLAAARASTQAAPAPEICVIGGARIYAQTLDEADRMYWTRVCAHVDGDARFPAMDWSQWRTRQVGATPASPKDAYPCEYFILERVRERG